MKNRMNRRRNTPLKALGNLVLLATLSTSALMLSGHQARAAEPTVNVYTYREEPLIKPLFEAFTKETGIKVNAIYGKDGLEQRIQAEGVTSPADLLISTDIAKLVAATEAGITQKITLPALKTAIPAHLQSAGSDWAVLTTRARVVYAAKDRVQQSDITYEELADPKWKGKLCMRSGQHPYNIALVAAYINKHGQEKAEAWLRGMKANLARKPAGGDRDVARDIAAGQCDIGLGNTYYMGLMLNREADKKPWAEATKVILPTFAGGGTHINVSGAILAKNAPNKLNAEKLLNWMLSQNAQKLYAESNFEYPAVAGVPVEKTIAGIGALKPDTTSLEAIAKQRKAASLLVDKVGFDQ